MGRKYKKGTCERCGDYTYVNDHHIVPKEIKKKNNKETIRLCVVCHIELHEVIPDEIKKEKDFKDFTIKWVAGLLFLIIFIGGYFIF